MTYFSQICRLLLFIGCVTRIHLILLQIRVVDPSCKKIDPDLANDENLSIKFGSFLLRTKIQFCSFLANLCESNGSRS